MGGAGATGSVAGTAAASCRAAWLRMGKAAKTGKMGRSALLVCPLISTGQANLPRQEGSVPTQTHRSRVTMPARQRFGRCRVTRASRGKSLPGGSLWYSHPYCTTVLYQYTVQYRVRGHWFRSTTNRRGCSSTGSGAALPGRSHELMSCSDGSVGEGCWWWCWCWGLQQQKS